MNSVPTGSPHLASAGPLRQMWLGLEGLSVPPAQGSVPAQGLRLQAACLQLQPGPF